MNRDLDHARRILPTLKRIEEAGNKKQRREIDRHRKFVDHSLLADRVARILLDLDRHPKP